MPKLTRNQFLRQGSTLATALGLGYAPAFAEEVAQAAARSGPVTPLAPDLILVNGRVFTVDPAQPRAEAFAVRNGRFVAVGRNDEIRPLATAGTQLVDAGGMTVVPGFIDAHSHPNAAGLAATTQVNLDVRSIAEVQKRLRAKAATTPPGEWVLGFMYDDTKVAENRMLTRRDLDEAVPDHPVFVTYRGGHIYWANSKAFEKADITPATPQPAGGQFYVEDGQLTGLVAENARQVFNGLLPTTSTREQRREGVKIVSSMMASAGLTSVTDAETSLENFIAYQDAHQAGEMTFRVYTLMLPPVYEHLKQGGLRTGFGDEWLRVGGVKFVADGGAATRTMYMSTPYVGRPNDYGILTMTQEQIHEAVDDAHSHGWQVGIHANGDLAIEYVLNAYDRALKRWPKPDARLRIEHCSLVTPQLLTRIRDGGYIPTPFYTYVYFHGEKWVAYGDEKMKMMFAHRSFLDYGIPVAAASDYTPAPYEPMMAIQSMVTRKDMRGRLWGVNQRITVDEALQVCTMNAARASFEEGIKGSITAGKLADFVILEKDPHEVDPDTIVDIRIVRTVLGGRTVFAA
ncbi:MAG: amidohydrolase family protein [Vicinamibacterales bacterium]